MKKNIPFCKDIDFNTNVYEISSISLEHNLKIKENEINGEFIISGDYKETEFSFNTEPFIYNIPFNIDLDIKYNTDNVKVDIDDFNYELLGENTLRINVVLKLDGLVEIEEIKEDNIIDYIDLLEDDTKENEDRNSLEEKEEKETVSENKEVTSIFNNLDLNDDGYVTYHVHIFREEDNVDNIIKLYNISKDDLLKYNDLEGIRIGSKIIIPSNE
ncbi:MAG: hypothetical protein IIZ40_04460 [Bacilli bacterium]|nr:hypothetical protein [Bacilli bacterium]